MKRNPLSCLIATCFFATSGQPAAARPEPTPADSTAAAREAFPAPSAALGISVELNVWAAIPSGVVKAGTATYSAVPEVFDGKPGWRVDDRLDFSLGGSSEHQEAEAHLDRELRVRAFETRNSADGAAVAREPYELGVKGWRRVSRKHDAESEPDAIATTAGMLLFLRLLAPDVVACEIPFVDEHGAKRRTYTIRKEAFMLGGGDVWMARPNGDGAQVALSLEGRTPVAIIEGGMYGSAFQLDRKYGVRDFAKRLFIEADVPPRHPRTAALHFAVGVLTSDTSLVTDAVHWPTAYASAKAAGATENEAEFKATTLAKLARYAKELEPGEVDGMLNDLTAGDMAREPEPGGLVRFVGSADEFDLTAGQRDGRWWVVGFPAFVGRGSRPPSEIWSESSRPEPAAGGKRLWFWARSLRAADDRRRDACADLGRLSVDGADVLSVVLARSSPDDPELRERVLGALLRVGVAAHPAVERAIPSAGPDGKRLLANVLGLLAHLDSTAAHGFDSGGGIPSSKAIESDPRRVQIEESIDHIKAILPYFLTDPPGPELGGKRFVLWILTTGPMMAADDHWLRLLFSPADRGRSFEKVGGVQAYSGITKKVLDDPMFDPAALTSYAGRRNGEKAHRMHDGELTNKTLLVADLSFPGGVILGYVGGVTRWVTAAELGLKPGVAITVGDESPIESLRHLSDR